MYLICFSYPIKPLEIARYLINYLTCFHCFAALASLFNRLHRDADSLNNEFVSIFKRYASTTKRKR